MICWKLCHRFSMAVSQSFCIGIWWSASCCKWLSLSDLGLSYYINLHNPIKRQTWHRDHVNMNLNRTITITVWKNCKQHRGVKSKDCSDILNIGRVAWLEKWFCWGSNREMPNYCQMSSCVSYYKYFVVSIITFILQHSNH